MCVGSFSGIVAPRPLPGSVYHSPEIFYKLWNVIQFDNAFGIELSSIWTYNRRRKEQKPCATTICRKLSGSSSPTGYLAVEANGGLNQQRFSICNVVALAEILNVVLVIPRFSFHSVWKDPRWRRAKLKVAAPDMTMELRTEKDPIEEDDKRVLRVMLRAVFPTVRQSEMDRIVSEKANKVAEGGEEDRYQEIFNSCNKTIVKTKKQTTLFVVNCKFMLAT
ncbi:hypothetical protein GIB67_007721 [Kingdonia uniflora]|uniref:O-fucosyltransferase family protein n=1 Tax=Kingdonia uniflora TaxID=39325 RepID=A0A7J7N223_9MAGN|nr:hypothetical protein GIB67_007721 [Kingdonia uniflora]